MMILLPILIIDSRIVFFEGGCLQLLFGTTLSMHLPLPILCSVQRIMIHDSKL